MHAGIDLQPDTDRLLKCCLFQNCYLVRMVQEKIKLVLLNKGEFIGMEEAFQQGDRRADAGAAQL